MEVHALARTALDRLAEMSSDQAALVFLVVLCFLYFLARFPATSSRIVAWMEKAGSFGMILSLGLVSLLAVVPTTYHHGMWRANGGAVAGR